MEAVVSDPSPTGKGIAAIVDEEDDGVSSQFSYRALLLRRPPPFMSEKAHREEPSHLLILGRW